MKRRTPDHSTPRRTPQPASAAAPASRAILVAFFLSGFAGLMHQVVWSKLLTVLVGATAHAQAVVLAVFMGGLALGAAWWGRRIDRIGRPLRQYALLEYAIAGYCLLLPLLLQLAGTGYEHLAGLWFESATYKLVLRLLLAIGTILLPAVLMGGTLPVLARHLVHEAGQTRCQVARLYGLNSLGAVLGVGVAGFWTIPAFGLYASLAIASSGNVLAALLVRRREPGEAPTRPVEVTPRATPEQASGPAPGWSWYGVSLVALGLSGFAAMGYEVFFVRVISLSFGLSVHSFAVMLMCFVTGIGLGSLVVSFVPIRRPLWTLALSQLVVATSLLALTPVLSRLPYYATLLRQATRGEPNGFGLFHAGQALLCLLVLLVPTTALGFGFPLVAQVQAARSSRVGALVGSTYAWNTVGNVLGTLVASLWLFASLGTLGVFECNVLASLSAGLLLLCVARDASRRHRTIVAAVVVAVCGLYAAVGRDWALPVTHATNHLRFDGTSAGPDGVDPTSSFANWRQAFVVDATRTPAWRFAEDAHATVLATRDATQISLSVNGKPDASTNKDLPAQMFLAHLPLMLRPDAARVLVIGHGSGITTGSALRYPVQHVDVVEISRAVLDVDPMFADFNYRCLQDPRVTVHEDDGQSFLRAAPQPYDVIISEPSNPWIAGIAGLFTADYFRAVRSKLAPGGVAAIWFHEYEQTRESVELVLRTIAASFEHLEVFRTHDYMDIIVVVSAAPLQPDFAAMERQFDEAPVRSDLARIQLTNLASLLLHHSLTGEQLRALLPAGPSNTTAHPRLEHLAPRGFFGGRTVGLVREHDALFARGVIADESMLARYIDYRRQQGEPLTRAENAEMARLAAFMGASSKRIAEVLNGLAAQFPAANATPSRTARGRVPEARSAGLFEADYWQQRLTKERDAARAGQFARRVDELVRAGSW